MLWMKREGPGDRAALALLLALPGGCEFTDCTPYDPGRGSYRCDEVWWCEVNGGPQYYLESMDGVVYDCQADGADCNQVVCDSCLMSDDERDFLCG